MLEDGPTRVQCSPFLDQPGPRCAAAITNGCDPVSLDKRIRTRSPPTLSRTNWRRGLIRQFLADSEPGCTAPACHPIFTGRILRLGGRANRVEYQTAPDAEPNQLQPNGTTADPSRRSTAKVDGRRFRQIG